MIFYQQKIIKNLYFFNFNRILENSIFKFNFWYKTKLTYNLRKTEEMTINIDINMIFRIIERCILNDLYADNDASMNIKTLNANNQTDCNSVENFKELNHSVLVLEKANWL